MVTMVTMVTMAQGGLRAQSDLKEPQAHQALPGIRGRQAYKAQQGPQEMQVPQEFKAKTGAAAAP